MITDGTLEEEQINELGRLYAMCNDREPTTYDEQNKCLRKDGTVGTLTADGSTSKHNNRIIEPKCEQVAQITDSGFNEMTGRVYGTDGLSPTCRTFCGGGQEIKIAESEVKHYRIRKLTPKECFRLQGVKDEDFEKIAKNQSNSSLYHLAGDSIVVDILCAIFKQMFDIDWEKV